MERTHQDAARSIGNRARVPLAPCPCAPIGAGCFGVGRFNRLVERGLRARGVLESEEFLRRQADHRDPQRPPDRPLQRRHRRRCGRCRGGAAKSGFPDLASGAERFLLAPSAAARNTRASSPSPCTARRAPSTTRWCFIPGDPESRVSTRELFLHGGDPSAAQGNRARGRGCRAHRGAAHNIPRHRAGGPACSALYGIVHLQDFLSPESAGTA